MIRLKFAQGCPLAPPIVSKCRSREPKAISVWLELFCSFTIRRTNLACPTFRPDPMEECPKLMQYCAVLDNMEAIIESGQPLNAEASCRMAREALKGAAPLAVGEVTLVLRSLKNTRFSEKERASLAQLAQSLQGACDQPDRVSVGRVARGPGKLNAAKQVVRQQNIDMFPLYLDRRTWVVISDPESTWPEMENALIERLRTIGLINPSETARRAIWSTILLARTPSSRAPVLCPREALRRQAQIKEACEALCAGYTQPVVFTTFPASMRDMESNHPDYYAKIWPEGLENPHISIEEYLNVVQRLPCRETHRSVAMTGGGGSQRGVLAGLRFGRECSPGCAWGRRWFHWVGQVCFVITLSQSCLLGEHTCDLSLEWCLGSCTCVLYDNAHFFRVTVRGTCCFFEALLFL
jgi:hypothetical protein